MDVKCHNIYDGFSGSSFLIHKSWMHESNTQVASHTSDLLIKLLKFLHDGISRNQI